MSQIASTPAHAAHSQGGHGSPVRIDPASVTMTGGAGIWSLGLLFVGALCLVLTVFGYFSRPLHALASYHVGALFTIGLALGSLMLVMIFHQFNAGWSVTLRRQCENVASLVPVAFLLLLPTALSVFFGRGSSLFTWADASHRDPTSAHFDPLLAHKAPFLNIGFYLVRLALYAVVWVVLSRCLYSWSRQQDQSGDRWLTARARFLSAPGIVLHALCIAFLGFDMIMCLDYHWFSTMFGVYFFAGNILSAIALLILILAALRRAGKLQGLVTEEHFHDLGKLLLAFTVFWAYITFSQYFLIWYSNIPEETGWYAVRKLHGWDRIGTALAAFHFGVPFLLLLWRGSKRILPILAFLALWQLVMHFVDLVYMVRPSIHPPPGEPMEGPFSAVWIDIGGWLAPTCIFLGLVARRIAANPLIPLKDPRLHEAVEHKNYV